MMPRQTRIEAEDDGAPVLLLHMKGFKWLQQFSEKQIELLAAFQTFYDVRIYDEMLIDKLIRSMKKIITDWEINWNKHWLWTEVDYE
jgi:hypothetical protein